MCTHTCTCTRTGTLHRLRARPFSVTPPCRQPHSVFGGHTKVVLDKKPKKPHKTKNNKKHTRMHEVEYQRTVQQADEKVNQTQFTCVIPQSQTGVFQLRSGHNSAMQKRACENCRKRACENCRKRACENCRKRAHSHVPSREYSHVSNSAHIFMSSSA